MEIDRCLPQRHTRFWSHEQRTRRGVKREQVSCSVRIVDLWLPSGKMDSDRGVLLMIEPSSSVCHILAQDVSFHSLHEKG